MATRPDVALLDIEMPGLDGLAAARALHERLPSCRVLILTTFGRPGYLRRAMEGGVVGFLVKDAPATELATAALSEGPNPLTEREQGVLAASGHGDTIAEIAESLFLSEGTVRNYLHTAIGKLGARNRVEAVRAAEEKGWL